MFIPYILTYHQGYSGQEKPQSEDKMMGKPLNDLEAKKKKQETNYLVPLLDGEAFVTFASLHNSDLIESTAGLREKIGLNSLMQLRQKLS